MVRIFKTFLVTLIYAAAIFILNCGGGGGSAQQLTVSISPTSPLESDFQSQYNTFKLTASVSGGVSYNYQWYKNGVAISGATSSELTAAEMGEEGHTVRGYEFKCVATAGSSAGEASVTIGGPNLSFDRGTLFHNLFRYYALNEGANSSIAALVEDTNANWISIGIVYFQSSITSTTIYEKTDTDPNVESTIAETDLISQIQYAHNLGLNVLLYPEIWIDGYSDVGPRDQITGSAEWFAAYQAKIENLADIAEANGVELFAVGVELNGTEDDEQKWRQLIASARNRYSGSVIYAANHTAGIIDAINWWDALDYIGATCNFDTETIDPSLGSDPTVNQLIDIYSQYLSVLNQVRNNFGKSVFITETGVYSVEGGTIRHTQYSSTADFQEQADYFEAVFETCEGQSWISGLVVIDWFPTQEQWYQDDPNWELSTSIIGKPAERVIKSWFSQ